MYATFDVEVPDGTLRVGRWGSGDRVVLAAHGLTANHMSFRALADQLGDEVTLLAPDLRGRGGSNVIAGPFGMDDHADDVARILETAAAGRPAILVGHSMGGFVVDVVAARHPDLVSSLVLVDGGIPPALGPLADLPVEDLVRAIIGPSLDRLRMTFKSVDDYFNFWRPHPALVDDWNEYVEDYLRYDLVGEPPALRSGVREDAVLFDSESDLRTSIVEESLGQLGLPITFLRAPRGVMNQEPPLFPETTLAPWQARLPNLRVVDVPDVNHFTIGLSVRGATAIADAVRQSPT